VAPLKPLARGRDYAARAVSTLTKAWPH